MSKVTAPLDPKREARFGALPSGSTLRRSRAEARFAWLLTAPALILIFALLLAPIVSSFWLSLHRIELTNPFAGRPFVGLGNYLSILQSRPFWESIGRTAYFTVVSIGLELILGLAIALLLNQKFRGRALLRSLILIPWALPVTVNGIMWRWILNSSYGSLNSFLWQLGLIDEYRAWLSDPFTAMNMVILADVWKMTPLVVLLLLAGLQGIPGELMESATVDGAGVWRRLSAITIPLLKPTILVVTILRTVDAFRVFDLIYVMTQGGPANGTMVISFYTYLNQFRFLNFGQGAALSYLITLIVGLLALAYMKAVQASEGERKSAARG